MAIGLMFMKAKLMVISISIAWKTMMLVMMKGAFSMMMVVTLESIVLFFDQGADEVDYQISDCWYCVHKGCKAIARFIVQESFPFIQTLLTMSDEEEEEEEEKEEEEGEEEEKNNKKKKKWAESEKGVAEEKTFCHDNGCGDDDDWYDYRKSVEWFDWSWFSLLHYESWWCR